MHLMGLTAYTRDLQELMETGISTSLARNLLPVLTLLWARLSV